MLGRPLRVAEEHVIILLWVVLGCVDSGTLDKELDDKLLRIRPGLSVDEISRDTGVPLEMLVPRDGQLLVTLHSSAGRRTASIMLECQLDDAERVASCSIAVARSHMQLMTRAEHDSLRRGQRVGSVLAALCEPEATISEPDGVFRLRYHRELPYEAYMPYWPVDLLFGKDGRLINKDSGRER
jgi:hypothetical protein